MEVRAVLRHTRAVPQKARLVGDLIRGKNVNDALNILTFTRKRVGKKIQMLCRIDTANEVEYYKNGGILQYVLRNMLAN